MQLLIGGDLVPTQSNVGIFCAGNMDALLGKKLASLWSDSDIRIFNLEVPLTDKVKPIPKCGPNLRTSTDTIKGIKALNPSLIALANNHILDQGIQGLESTVRTLFEGNIPCVGVGDNKYEACKPYIFRRDGFNIGIYACTENEFSIATDKSAGANPFDPLESLDQVAELKSKCDYVIILYHGGKEHYRYPSPYLQKICRKMVQKGADLVVCQHSHCIGCYEIYEEATIVYGQGNFLFDYSDNEFWKTSILIKVDIKDRPHIEYIPIVKNGNAVCLAEGPAAKDILAGFQKRSVEILQDDFVEQEYLRFAVDNLLFYEKHFAGFGKWLSRIDRRLFKGALLKRKYNNNQLLTIQNFIECEAHRELILAGLKEHNERGKE